jgi:nicotinamidase-related amidase
MRMLIPWEGTRSGGRFSITEWDIDPRRTALLFVDLQRGYVDRDLGIGPRIQARFPEVHEHYYPRLEKTVVPNARRLSEFFRARGVQTIYTRMGLQLADGRDVAPWSWRRQRAGGEQADLFATGTPEHDLIPELTVTRDDLVLDKNTLSPFSSTAIDQVLRNMGVENLVISGVTTNAAIETTARDAGDRGYCPIVVEDAVAAYLPDDHDGAPRRC